MSDYKILELDFRQEKQENVVTDDVKLDDNTLDYIVPDYRPFFSASVEITDAAGQLRKEGTDYELVELITPLTLKTGKDVRAFIRIKNTDLYAKSPLKVKYHSLGINHFPKAMVAQTGSSSSGGNSNEIDYETQILGKPTTFPFKPHKHDVEKEIAGWDDINNLIIESLNYRRNHILEKYQELKGIADATWSATDEIAIALRNEIALHDRDYNNPHHTVKGDLELGNVDNFGTATTNDELLGVSNKFSTPLGAEKAINNTLVDTNEYHHTGRVPLSYYGTDVYIPPPIEGDFKGLGSNADTGAFCIEDNGDLVMLTNASDGKNNGLFFYIIKNYLDPNTDFKYTNYPYQQNNVDYRKLNAIVNGSGKDILLVGNRSSTDWYITLTNGTFNPERHNLLKCTFDTQPTGMWEPYANNETRPWFDNSTVFIAGGKAWLFYFNHRVYNNNLRMSKELYIYSIDLSLLSGSSPVVWKLETITSYQDPFGTTKVNGKPLMMSDVTQDANGYYNKNWANYTLPLISTYHWVAPGVIVADYDDTSNKKLMFIELETQSYYYLNGVIKEHHPCFQFVFVFDPDAKTFLLHPKSGKNYTCNLTNTALNPPAMQPSTTRKWTYCGGGYRSSICWLEGAIVKLENEGWLKSLQTPTDPLTLFLNPFDAAAITPKIYKQATKHYPTVFPPGAVQSSYSEEGEYFGIWVLGTSFRSMYFRKSTNDFETRTDMTWDGSPVVIRMPTNEDFLINGDPNIARIAVTGDAKALNSVSSKLGWTGFSAWDEQGAFGKFSTWPVQTNAANVVLPLSVSMDTSTPGIATPIVNKTITYPKTMMTKLKSTLTAGVGTIAYNGFSVHDFTGNPFTDAWSVAFLFYTKPGYAGIYSRFCFYTPTYTSDANGNATVTGVTVKYTSAEVVNSQDRFPSGSTFSYVGGTELYPVIEMYYDKTNEKHAYIMYPGVHLNPTSTSLGTPFKAQPRVKAVRIKSDNTVAIEENTVRPAWYNDDQFYTCMPKVGRLTVYGKDVINIMSRTGTVADQGGVRYIMSHSYPAENWFIYFTDEIKVTIEGGSYMLYSGTVNLYDIDSDPVNKTFYVYVKLRGDKASYVITENKLYTSNKLLFVAEIVTGEKGITGITRHQPMMIGDLTISLERRGGAIPAISGTLDQTTQIVWSRTQDK